MGRNNNSTSQSSVSLSSFRAANLCNRFYLLMILVIVILCSSYFNHSLVLMSNQMKVDESEFERLKNIVKAQSIVIQRFNESITNTDVVQKVSFLEEKLKTTESHMEEEMKHSQEKVANLLETTLKELNTTVSSAKAQIHDEVLFVKEDVAKYASDTNEKFNMENSFMVYQLAGTFTLIACLISMWHMTAHLRRFKRPFVQRKILAILWMSPIYGITSWLSLVFPRFEIYFGTIKDFYEAYTIYQFLSFLIGVLGRGNRYVVVDKLARHSDHLEPPFRLFGCCTEDPYDTPKKKADGVLLQCQAFAMQFVFLKPLTAIGIFLCKKFYIDDGEPSYMTPKFWIIMLQNLSVFIAFSGLLKFYHAAQDDFAWCRPFPKFLCIKGIVFMTFWQGLAISILADTTTAGRTKEASETWAAQAQNFLICLEMLLFSIAHFYCFPTDEWQDGYQPVENKDARFGDNIALRDFFDDLRLIVGSGGGDKKQKGRKGIKNNVDDSPPGTPDTNGESPGESSPISKSSPLTHKGNTAGNDDEENRDLMRRSRRLSVRIIQDALGSLEDDSDSNSAVERVRMSLRQTDGKINFNDFDTNKNLKSLSGYGSILGEPPKNDLQEIHDVPKRNEYEDETDPSTETTSLLSQPVSYDKGISSTTESTSLLGQPVRVEEETLSTEKEISLLGEQTSHEEQNNQEVENSKYEDQSTCDEEAKISFEPTVPINQSLTDEENNLQSDTTHVLGGPTVISEGELNENSTTNNLTQPASSEAPNSDITEVLRPSLFTIHNT